MSELETIPLIDTSHGTNFSSMFNNCTALKNMPLINTSNGTNFSQMFLYASDLETIPLIDTSHGTNFESMFRSCSKLTTIPELDTSQGTNFSQTFNTCTLLSTLPELDFSSAQSITNMLVACSSLKDFGGLKNLGLNFNVSAGSGVYNLNLASANKLTHDSLMNVINDLYDIASRGSNPQKLTLGATNLAKLSAAEIAIATNKGWTVS